MGEFHSATLSIVITTELHDLPSPQLLNRLLASANKHFAMAELIIVANGVDALALDSLEQIVAEVPDVTTHVLVQQVERDAAVLFGLDNALGDWVLLMDAEEDQVREVPAMLELMRDKVDGLLLEPRGIEPFKRSVYDFAADCLVRACGALTGIPFERSAARIRMINRALCMRIVGDVHSELLLRWMPSESAFRVERHHGGYAPSPVSRQKRTLTQGIVRGLGVLTRSSGVPLRVLSLASSILALLSFLYPVYVILIYSFKRDTVPGWATISLQLSALTFVVSLMFLMIAEYLIMIRTAMPPRRRVAVAREMKSTRTARREILNVVDSEGRGLEPPELTLDPAPPADIVARKG